MLLAPYVGFKAVNSSIFLVGKWGPGKFLCDAWKFTWVDMTHVMRGPIFLEPGNHLHDWQSQKQNNSILVGLWIKLFHHRTTSIYFSHRRYLLSSCYVYVQAFYHFELIRSNSIKKTVFCWQEFIGFWYVIKLDIKDWFDVDLHCCYIQCEIEPKRAEVLSKRSTCQCLL